jgi:hypothetical protein
MLIKYFCCLCILISLFTCGCNCHRGSGTTIECISFLKSRDLPFDTSKVINDYVLDITGQFSSQTPKDIEKSYRTCTKPEIMRYYLQMHPQIDSVIITSSGHGISFYRKDENVWSNIIIE